MVILAICWLLNEVVQTHHFLHFAQNLTVDGSTNRFCALPTVAVVSWPSYLDNYSASKAFSYNDFQVYDSK